jgi:SEC-C motif-containing protein
MTSSLCPCGSALPFSACCGPILENHALAETAEALMRSRYTAFVQKHEPHILASWHARTRPKSLNFDDHPVVWLGLQIHDRQEGAASDSSGTVDFTTSYLENGQLCRLREKSEFLKEDGLWFYLRGECQIKKEKVERNQPCPCGSAKKFKKCCLRG